MKNKANYVDKQAFNHGIKGYLEKQITLSCI